MIRVLCCFQSPNTLSSFLIFIILAMPDESPKALMGDCVKYLPEIYCCDCTRFDKLLDQTFCDYLL